MTNVKRVKIVLFSIIFIVLLLWLIDYINNAYKSNYEKNLINSYFEKEGTPKKVLDNNYMGILEIPKINLKRGFYNKNNSRNNINKNIMFVGKFDDKDFIFAAHSGNSPIAYFNDIHLLNYNDIINLYYKNKKISYVVYNKYLDNKNGNVNIQKNSEKRIILITCNNNDPNNYLVIEAKLKEK